MDFAVSISGWLGKTGAVNKPRLPILRERSNYKGRTDFLPALVKSKLKGLAAFYIAPAGRQLTSWLNRQPANRFHGNIHLINIDDPIPHIDLGDNSI